MSLMAVCVNADALGRRKDSIVEWSQADLEFLNAFTNG